MSPAGVGGRHGGMGWGPLWGYLVVIFRRKLRDAGFAYGSPFLRVWGESFGSQILCVFCFICAGCMNFLKWGRGSRRAKLNNFLVTVRGWVWGDLPKPSLGG